MAAAEPTLVLSPKDNQKRIEEIARYNLRRYMQLRGVGQQELAKAWGVSQGAVSQRLNGVSQIKLTEAVVASHVLNVSIDDILDDRAYEEDKELSSLLARQQEEVRQLKEKFTQNMIQERENPASHSGAGSKRYVLDSDVSDKGGARISGRRIRPRTGC